MSARSGGKAGAKPRAVTWQPDTSARERWREQVTAALRFISQQLAGVVNTLLPLTAAFSNTIDTLASSLTQLQQQVQIKLGMIDLEKQLKRLPLAREADEATL